MMLPIKKLEKIYIEKEYLWIIFYIINQYFITWVFALFVTFHHGDDAHSALGVVHV